MVAKSGKKREHGPEDLQEEIEALRDAVHSMADKVKRRSVAQGQEAIDKAKEHPGAVLGVAVAVGMLLGMLIKK